LTILVAGDDDANDGKLGLLCNDGEFEPLVSLTWPLEVKCLEVATCQSIPQPPADSLFKTVATTETPFNYSLFFGCNDSSAIIDDGSGVNFFEVQCLNIVTDPKHGIVVNGSFVEGDPTYPKCMSQCPLFTVGNPQFRPMNDQWDVRAGETHRFDCPDGFYVDGEADDITYLNSSCLPEGVFETSVNMCKLLPCRDDDINNLTQSQPDILDPATLMTTISSGDIMPASSIYFNCKAPMVIK
jgi:hypothetical protein